MRAQLAMFLVLAAGVAGCASNPPPPPPMAMAPEPAPMPAPAPMAAGAMDGMYRGTVESGADNAARCRKMAPTASARVRGNMFALGGARGRVAADGTLGSAARRGAGLTGTLANGTLDATTMVGRCSYHYVLNKA